ncbi:MAG: pyridoxal-phosphate dependent enzyme, partial [Bacteroidota bacterium]
MSIINISDITTDKISLNLFSEKNVEASVLRLDKIHPEISGNKWFKLRYYLEEAEQLNKKTIVTFGGAWSNHIVATAAACSENGFSSIGIIRGEETSTLSPTLKKAKELGMQLNFISREDYSLKKIPGEIKTEEYYIINEGGYGIKGAEGAATILDQCKKESFTHICCATGTGTMMAGLINAALPEQEVIGISVLKNNFDLEENVRSLLIGHEKKIELI